MLKKNALFERLLHYSPLKALKAKQQIQVGQQYDSAFLLLL